MANNFVEKVAEVIEKNGEIKFIITQGNKKVIQLSPKQVNKTATEIAKMVEEMLPIVSKPEFDFADDYGAGKYAGEKAMLREIKRRLGI
jgi:hypothetical protein